MLHVLGAYGLQCDQGGEFLPCPESMLELMNGEESKQVCPYFYALVIAIAVSCKDNLNNICYTSFVPAVLVVPFA